MQITPDGSVPYYSQDQIGSTRALVNSAGNVVATYSCDRYGNQTVFRGTVTGIGNLASLPAGGGVYNVNLWQSLVIAG